MNDFFRNCDSFLVEAASITTRDDSRVRLLDSIPQNAVKQPRDFTLTDKDLIERPNRSEKMSIYYPKKVPLDHKGVPIIGFPKSAKTYFRDKYLGDYPPELKEPDIHTGILVSNKSFYGTVHTLCTASPMSSDCIMLTYEYVTKPISAKGTWGKTIQDHHLAFIIFPIHFIPRVYVDTSGYCFLEGDFDHNLASELNDLYRDSITMENYLYLKAIEDENKATQARIEEAIKRGNPNIPTPF